MTDYVPPCEKCQNKIHRPSAMPGFIIDAHNVLMSLCRDTCSCNTTLFTNNTIMEPM